MSKPIIPVNPPQGGTAVALWSFQNPDAAWAAEHHSLQRLARHGIPVLASLARLSSVDAFQEADVEEEVRHDEDRERDRRNESAEGARDAQGNGAGL